MQRLTKYPLLLKAILKKTFTNNVKEQLQFIVSKTCANTIVSLLVLQIEDMEKLVEAINLAVHRQEEVERVKDVAHRITAYNMGDFPRGWDEVITSWYCYVVFSLHCVVSSSFYATGLDGSNDRS